MKNWYVLAVSTKKELEVCERLENYAETYAPLRTVVARERKHSRKKSEPSRKTIRVPVLNGYVFALMDFGQTSASVISKIPNAHYWIEFDGWPLPVPPCDIDKLKEIEATGTWDENSLAIIEENLKLFVGQRLSIKAGPLAEREAIVKIVKKNQITLQLNNFKKELQISLAKLKKIL